jgi:hypothetical protein
LLNEDIRVITVDHESRFLDHVRDNAAEHGVAERVETIHAPLRWYRRGMSAYCTYDMAAVDSAITQAFDEPLDTIFIDGPPSWTGGGRVGLIEELIARRFYGARLAVVDDASRGLERFALAQLRQRTSGPVVEVLDVGHGLGVVSPRDASWSPMSFSSQAYLAARGIMALGKQGARRVLKGARHP